MFKWGQHLAAPDAIAIGFSLSLPAGVEIGADFFCGYDANGGRKQGVEGALKFGGGEGGLRLEMRHLTERVDARVGAACALDEDFLLGDLARGLGDWALDCPGAGVGLHGLGGG